MVIAKNVPCGIQEIEACLIQNTVSEKPVIRMSYERLVNHRKIWKRKKILRRIYREWYTLLMAHAREGNIVELGSGAGHLAEQYSGILSSDIIPCPWINIVCDATSMPFKEESIHSLMLIDVLHHLGDIQSFFREVERVLKINGRLIMLEPYISPLSFFIYRCFHQEPVVFNVDVFAKRSSDIQNHKKEPFDSNSAIPTILFKREEKRFKVEYPRLQIIKKDLLTFFLYPLSGGIKHRSFIPNWSFSIIGFIEKLMRPVAKLFAFRIFIVIEKTNRG
jgi:SAM-dependent methyltransferase